MQSSKKPVAIAYQRVSTDKQGRSGLGLADQDRVIREFCAARGLTLAASFVEIESGKNSDRPELARALNVARRKGGILVIATLSRLGRRVSFVANLMEQGVPFACADAPDDEPFILHVKASFAEEEARKISARTKVALAVAKARGTKLGTPANLSLDARLRGAATVRERARADHAAILPENAKARSEGQSVRAIAARVGVSPMTVSRLLATAA
ncbi:MAG: recombinase family protein [Candidatus Eremiobacteraeota bacterium]|nr:recombinase family protein [Candidatus Eremiobacteraeota bacterium]